MSIEEGARRHRWLRRSHRRAVTFDVNGLVLRVAALGDVIRSKEAADRPKDHVTLPVLYALREELGLGPGGTGASD